MSNPHLQKAIRQAIADEWKQMRFETISSTLNTLPDRFARVATEAVEKYQQGDGGRVGG